MERRLADTRLSRNRRRFLEDAGAPAHRPIAVRGVEFACPVRGLLASVNGGRGRGSIETRPAAASRLIRESRPGANPVSDQTNSGGDLQQKYRQFLDLLPLTLSLAGLPT